MIARSSGANAIGSAADRAGPNSKGPASITAAGTQPQIPARKRCAYMLPPNSIRTLAHPIKSFSTATASGETPICLPRERGSLRSSSQAGTTKYVCQTRDHGQVTMSPALRVQKSAEEEWRLQVARSGADHGARLPAAAESLTVDQNGAAGRSSIECARVAGCPLPKGTPALVIARNSRESPGGTRWRAASAKAVRRTRRAHRTRSKHCQRPLLQTPKIEVAAQSQGRKIRPQCACCAAASDCAPIGAQC